MPASMVIYHKQTGDIFTTWTCDLFDLGHVFRRMVKGDTETYDFIVGEANPFIHYVDVETATIVEKTPFPITVDGNIIKGIPTGTNIFDMTDFERFDMDASEKLELTVPFPQTVSIRLKHPHHLAETIEVICT